MLLKRQEERCVVLTRKGIEHETYRRGTMGSVEFDPLQVLALKDVYMFYHNHPYGSGANRSQRDIRVCHDFAVSLADPFYYVITDFKEIQVWYIEDENTHEWLCKLPYKPYRSFSRYRMNFRKLIREIKNI